MSIINSRKSVIFVALLVLLSAGIGGVVMAASPTVDTETTDTSQESEITDGGTQTYNDTTSSNLSWSADSANSSVEITHDGETVFESSPEHYESVDSDDDGTTDTWYFNVSLADDTSDYDGLEVGADENVTLNATLVNDTEADDPDTTNVSYEFQNSDETAFIASEDPESEEDDGGIFATLNVFSSDDENETGATLSTDETTVTDNTSQVQLDTVDSNLTDAFATSTEDASEGDLVWSSYTQLTVDDESQYVPVYYQSADEDDEWLNSSEDTYATISADGETMTIHNPDAMLGEDESSATLDVTTVGDEMLGAQNARSMLKNDQYDTSTTTVWTTSFVATDLNGNPDFVDDELEA